MKRSRSSFTLLAAAAAALFGIGAAHAQGSVPVAAAEGGRLWFVELAGAPVADGNSRTAVQTEKASFRAAARAAGASYTERRSFDVLFNGFSVLVDEANRLKLARLPGVKAVYPVEVIAAPSPELAAGSAIDLARAITMTGASVAQDARGLTGAGIKVGIIDTGVDIDHPAFGGGGVAGGDTFPTARVIAGYDFVGDAYDQGTNPVTVPDPNPDDCNGHGTHVAGIVGANGGGLKGVAPGVSFGAYRVFGCAGSTSADIMIAAMEMALADGMQVVNQSIGSRAQWPQYPTAQAASRMANKGVVMVASIGNNGPGGSAPDGLFAAGAPGVGDKVIGVASFDNGQRSFTVGGTPYGYNTATAAPLPPTSGSLPMAKTGTTTTANDGCSPLVAGSLTGSAVLIRRGTCSFHIKSLNAQNAGASAVVLYNNAAGALNATVAGTPAITIPVVAITAAQGATLDAAITAGPTSLTWTADAVGYPFGTGGLISGFSSFGLTAELGVKPNIGAPGGGIFSAYPLEAGGAATLSGTSMSSPHVAGAAALVLQGRPDINPRTMGTRMQNSADPKNWSGNPGLGKLEHAHRQGAGMLDIIGVLDSTTVVEPSQIAVGESQAGPKVTTVTVKNTGSSAVTYDLAHAAALATGPNVPTSYPSAGIVGFGPSGAFDTPATVTFSTPSVVVPANSSASFNVTIDANAGLVDRGIYGGYVVLTPQGGGATYRVPFAGFKGDYQSTQVLTPTANGFPWLAQLVGTSYLNRNAAGATYTMLGNDIPFFLVHLDHQSRRMRLEAFDAVSGKNIGRVSDDEYVGRNSTPGGFFALPWDGLTFRGKGKNESQISTAANGTYTVKLSVLKALGDEANPAHWETWSSATITIARP